MLSAGTPAVRYGCRSCGGASGAYPSGNPINVWRSSRVLQGEERSKVVSLVIETEDYKVVSRQLGELGFQPMVEEAFAAEAEEVREGVVTRWLGISLGFARKGEGVSLAAVFLLEPSHRSFVYKLDQEKKRIVLVGGTVRGKSIILQSGGASTLSSCPPCYALVNECVSIDLACVANNCYDCYDACVTSFPVCVGCLIFWCGFGSLYMCCNFQLVCEPCTPDMTYLPECMGCF